MIKMILSFVTFESSVALNQTVFSHSLLGRRLISVRGSTAPPDVGTFRWSSGVRGLSLLLTRQAIVGMARRTEEGNGHDSASIEGDTNSLAASLDYAISKQPLWLQDMFGATPQGTAISKLLFRRMNPDRKRPGPVTVFIANGDFDVVIEINGETLNGEQQMRQLERSLAEMEIQSFAV
jgi:hypothetical protein